MILFKGPGGERFSNIPPGIESEIGSFTGDSFAFFSQKKNFKTLFFFFKFQKQRFDSIEFEFHRNKPSINSLPPFHLLLFTWSQGIL